MIPRVMTGTTNPLQMPRTIVNVLHELHTRRSKAAQQEHSAKKICSTLCTIKPSAEHGEPNHIVVSLQPVMNVSAKSMHIIQYEIIPRVHVRHSGRGPGYNGIWEPSSPIVELMLLSKIVHFDNLKFSAHHKQQTMMNS